MPAPVQQSEASLNRNGGGGAGKFSYYPNGTGGYWVFNQQGQHVGEMPGQSFGQGWNSVGQGQSFSPGGWGGGIPGQSQGYPMGWSGIAPGQSQGYPMAWRPIPQGQQFGPPMGWSGGTNVPGGFQPVMPPGEYVPPFEEPPPLPGNNPPPFDPYNPGVNSGFPGMNNPFGTGSGPWSQGPSVGPWYGNMPPVYTPGYAQGPTMNQTTFDWQGYPNAVGPNDPGWNGPGGGDPGGGNPGANWSGPGGGNSPNSYAISNIGVGSYFDIGAYGTGTAGGSSWPFVRAE